MKPKPGKTSKPAPVRTYDPAEQKALQTFLTWAYWTTGIFTVAWMAKAAVAVTRFYQHTDMPLFGPCATSEVIVYSLLVLLPPLVILHLLTYAYQARRTRFGYRDGFPGVVGDQEIPPSLRTLRVLLFLVLVLLPSFLYGFLTVRCIHDLKIVWKPGWEDGTGTLGGWQKLWPASTPNGDGRWIFAPDWRWQHKYVEWQKIQDTRITTTSDPLTGKKTISATMNEDKAIPVMVTAVPGLQPGIYVLAACGFVASSLLLLYRGCSGERR